MTISSSLKYETRKMEQNMAKLQENFLHNFAWNGEDAYKQAYHVKELQKILTDMMVEEDMDKDLEIAEWYIRDYSKFIRRGYNVRENSTGALHREVSTWKYVVTIEILDYLEAIVKDYKNI